MKIYFNKGCFQVILPVYFGCELVQTNLEVRVGTFFIKKSLVEFLYYLNYF